MHLIDWFKNLKWIKAIRRYKQVEDNYNDLLEGYSLLVEENKRLRYKNEIYERAGLDISIMPPDQRSIFENHRRASLQAINDAYETRLKYEKKNSSPQ